MQVELQRAIDARVSAFREQNVLERIWLKDFTVWRTEQTTRAFNVPLHSAVGFMNFVNTPIFGWFSSLITSPLVQTPMRWLLANA